MKILLVEDNADHRELMSLALTRHDPTWEVEEVLSGEEALSRLAEGKAYDLVLLDYRLPKRDGLEVLEEIKRGVDSPPVVMVTGRGDEQVAVKAMKGGAYDYIVKAEDYLQRLPIVAHRAMEAQKLAVERKRAEEELRSYRDHLEELVEMRTRELEEINAELESFASSVSHDLRAPLRAMQGFSQALLEDYAPKLDEQGKDYARRIAASSERMHALIRDLLEYSRLSRSEVELKKVNLGWVIEAALRHLQPEIEASGAHIDVREPLPEVVSHAPTLERVVGNLIRNAIKFVPAGVKPEVTVWAEQRDKVVKLWVEDNGIGISPEHHEKIFHVFERLYGIEAYPGTGIGLAMVRRGMEKLAGKSGVESTPGRGSRFWIELGTVKKR